MQLWQFFVEPTQFAQDLWRGLNFVQEQLIKLLENV
jgi:hypothetical protein